VAKALQCPDCGTRHPLDQVAGLRTFRCEECNRLLKVPASVATDAAAVASAPPKKAAKARTAAGAKAATGAATGAATKAGAKAGTKAGTKTPPSRRADKTKVVAADNGAARKVPPSQRGTAIADQTAKGPAVERASGEPARRRRVSTVARVGAWVAAVPMGLIPVLLVGRSVGVFTSAKALDVFVGIGWGRFVMPLLLLLVWSLVSATIAHLIIERAGRGPRTT